MFALIESNPARRGSTDWTSRLASATLHTALVAAAIVATQHVAAAPLPGIIEVDAVWQTPPTPAPPSVSLTALTPTIPSPSWPTLPTLPINVPTEIPPPGTSEMTFVHGNDPFPGPVVGNPIGIPTGQAPLDVRYVDEQPIMLAHPAVNYPDVLRQAGIEGRVLVEAVLDTLGRAEPATLRVTESPNPLFDREALAVVAASHYRPGRVDGRAVRVRIQVPVAFSLRR